MDGVRGYWDGRRLLSRKGKEFPVPDFFVRDLPPISLDGELWMGRNSFERICAVTQNEKADWNQIVYYLFDSPHFEGTYDQRLESLNKLKLPPHVKVVSVQKC